jgi:carbon-monoxide dehydrogenase small subunit
MIDLVVNGESRRLEVPCNELLIDTLRERLGLCGTKRSCDVQICGACTVLLDGVAVSSCCTLTHDVGARSVLTIEGVEGPGGLHPVQHALVRCNAIQCGFCTPGIVMAALSYFEGPKDEDEDVAHYMEGNICRCTGYERVLEAITSLSEDGVPAE